MKFIKTILLLFGGFIYNSCLLFSFESSIKPTKYISATVAISADGFVSLEQAFTNVQSEFAQTKLQTVPTSQRHYHMTLQGFDLAIVSGLSKIKQNVSIKSINNELGKAFQEALKNNLDYLENKAIALKFAYIGVFQKKIVAVFEMTKEVQDLIDDIENCFKRNIQHLINNGTIANIRKHQDILQPHVSLAKIVNHNSCFGAGLLPKVEVKDFHITKPVALISVQLRKIKLPVKVKILQPS